MKRVFLIHGWDGAPDNHWFPWLTTELTKRGFKVEALAMPNPSEPKIETWIPFIADAIGEVDKDTYCIGHSIGCQAILRYLETLPKGKQIGGAVFVAGFFQLPFLKTAEEKIIAQPWSKTSLDVNKIKQVANAKIAAIFSDNDSDVDFADEKLFQQRLNAVTIIEHAKGHFTAEDGVTELPVVLKAFLEIASPPEISIDDFSKLDIRMGKIITAEAIAGTDKLLKLQIDLGSGDVRTICSGIAKFYKPEDLPGKLVPVLTNIKPRTLKGIESRGMVLFAIDETDGKHEPIILFPIKDLPLGSPIQ